MRCPRCDTTSWGIYTLFEIRAGTDVINRSSKSLLRTAVWLTLEGKVERTMDGYVITKKGRAAMRCPCAARRLAQYDAPLPTLRRDIRRG